MIVFALIFGHAWPRLVRCQKSEHYIYAASSLSNHIKATNCTTATGAVARLSACVRVPCRGDDNNAPDRKDELKK